MTFAPEKLGYIFKKLSNIHTMVSRNTKFNHAIPEMRSGKGKKSFAFRGADAWNRLESE